MTIIKKWWTFVRDPQHSGAVIAIFTVVIALTGAIYTGFSCLQWVALRESNRINRDSIAAIQRPFLTVEVPVGARSFFGGPVGKHPVWTFGIGGQNTGPTPAVEARTYLDADNLPNPPDDSKFAVSQDKISITKSDIGPKEPVQFSVIDKPNSFIFGDNFDPNNPTVSNIPKNIYFWGWIAYRDTFPDTKAHLTEFCKKMTRVKVETDPPDLHVDLTDPKQKLTFDFSWASCEKHNCVDERCEDYSKIVKAVYGDQ